MRKTKYCIEEAKRIRRDEGAAEAIWLLENAFHAPGGTLEEETELAAIVQGISDEDLRRAAEKATSNLRHVVHMLTYPNNMDSEEWLLILGRISDAHCVQLFANRTGRVVDIPTLPIAVSMLREATGELTDVAFKRALGELRSRFPSPLPQSL